MPALKKGCHLFRSRNCPARLGLGLEVGKQVAAHPGVIHLDGGKGRFGRACAGRQTDRTGRRVEQGRAEARGGGRLLDRVHFASCQVWFLNGVGAIAQFSLNVRPARLTERGSTLLEHPVNRLSAASASRIARIYRNSWTHGPLQEADGDGRGEGSAPPLRPPPCCGVHRQRSLQGVHDRHVDHGPPVVHPVRPAELDAIVDDLAAIPRLLDGLFGGPRVDGDLRGREDRNPVAFDGGQKASRQGGPAGTNSATEAELGRDHCAKGTLLELSRVRLGRRLYVPMKIGDQ